MDIFTELYDGIDHCIGGFRGFKEVMGLPGTTCQTGEKYITFTGHVKQEGCYNPLDVYKASDVALAWCNFYTRFDEYAADKKGTIYWRSCPRMHYLVKLYPGYPRNVVSHINDIVPDRLGEAQCFIVARFVISDKPSVNEYEIKLYGADVINGYTATIGHCPPTGASSTVPVPISVPATTTPQNSTINRWTWSWNSGIVKINDGKDAVVTKPIFPDIRRMF